MTLTEVMDLINEIEEKYPVDEWLVDDIHIWPILRISLGMRLGMQDWLPEQVKPTPRYIRYLKYGSETINGILRYFRGYILDCGHNCSPKNPVDIVFHSDGISYCNINGKWIEKFCDPIIINFNKNNFTTFLISPLHKYFIPRFTSSMFIQPKIDFYKIKSRLLKSKPLSQNLPEFSGFTTYLKPKIDLKSLLGGQSLETYVQTLQNLVCFYKKILKKLSPRLCFQVSYYGTQGMVLNMACRELNIYSIDIQHGFQGELHPAYGGWNKVPSTGYEVLPLIFWVWSDNEKYAIEKWAHAVSKYHRVVVGGHPFFEFGHDSKTTQIYEQKVLEYKNQNLYNILYVFHSLETTAQLYKIFNLMKKVEIPCRWWLRCHPCNLSQKEFLRDMIRKLNFTNYELDMATDFPLYAILKYMDLHITECSSTVLEAEFLNVPSVITSPYGARTFFRQIQSGIAKAGFTEEEIITAIHSQLEASPKTKIQWGTINQGIKEVMQIANNDSDN